MKKVIGAGTSAALVASLLATAVAPAAMAAVTNTNFGNVVQPFGAGTSTSAPFSITFTEQSITSFGSTGAGELQVNVLDKNGANAANITLGGTLVVTAPGYAGVTASVAGNVLTIDSSGPFDPGVLESISVSGITATITSAVPTGALKANVQLASGDLAIAGWTTGASASGLLHTGAAQTTTSLLVDVSGSCAFVNATGGTAGDYMAGTTDLGLGTVSALSGGQQTITLATGLAGPLAAGVTISQTSACAATLPFGLLSPGTVVAGVKVTTSGALNVQPGENNQLTGTVILTEPATSSVIGVGSLTFTVAGAVFSAPPSVGYTGGLAGGGLCSLSFDRTSCTVSISSGSTSGGGTVTLSNIKVDLSSSTAQGATVTIAVAGSPVFATIGSPVTVANVSRLVVSLAAQPTVFIGFNDQPSGMVSLTETQAGFFSSDPSSPTNAFGICLDPKDLTKPDHFTRTPVAVVTAGDLKLASGSPIAPATQAVGTLVTLNVAVNTGDIPAPVRALECAIWRVYTSSTAVSTIQIRGTDATGAVLASGATNGVNLSIDADAQPGVVQAQIVLGFGGGASGFSGIGNGLVGIATRAFKNQPVVAALSQPTIAAGTARAVLGNLTIAETQAGQFKPNENICVSVVPLNLPEGYQFQTHFITTTFTADQPVITANSTSGLLTGAPYALGQNSFCFQVNQQATGTLGVITIGNMVVYTPTDATMGSILLNVAGGFGSATNFDNTTGTFTSSSFGITFSAGQAFEQVVAAGKIGTAPSVNFAVGTAFGATKNATFTAKTKVVKLSATNKYVTWRFSAPKALAGKVVVISVLTKLADGTWGAPKALTTRLIDINGNAYFWWKSTTATWVAVSATYAGDNNYAMSVSASPQARWMK